MREGQKMDDLQLRGFVADFNTQLRQALATAK